MFEKMSSMIKLYIAKQLIFSHVFHQTFSSIHRDKLVKECPYTSHQFVGAIYPRLYAILDNQIILPLN
jgi:hypothetical protein